MGSISLFFCTVSIHWSPQQINDLIHVSILIIFPSHITCFYDMLILCYVYHLFCSSLKMSPAPVFKCLRGTGFSGLPHSNSCCSHYTSTQTFELPPSPIFSSFALSGLSIITSLQPQKRRNGREGRRGITSLSCWPFASAPLQSELLMSPCHCIPNTKQVQQHRPASCFFSFPKPPGNTHQFWGVCVFVFLKNLISYRRRS